jgi:hypothetical protein
VHSNINIGNIKYGVFIGLGNTMYLDIYCGIGIRYRDIKNPQREYNPDAGVKFANIEPVMNSYYLEESSGFYPNLSAGFKFGIRF